MSECRRCGKNIKNLRAHMLRVHPEEFWWKADMPRPHASAIAITLESVGHCYECGGGERLILSPDDSNHSDAIEVDGRWVVARYGGRRHGWFIPIEVEDNYETGRDPYDV